MAFLLKPLLLEAGWLETGALGGAAACRVGDVGLYSGVGGCDDDVEAVKAGVDGRDDMVGDENVVDEY